MRRASLNLTRRRRPRTRSGGAAGDGGDYIIPYIDSDTATGLPLLAYLRQSHSEDLKGAACMSPTAVAETTGRDETVDLELDQLGDRLGEVRLADPQEILGSKVLEDLRNRVVHGDRVFADPLLRGELATFLLQLDEATRDRDQDRVVLVLASIEEALRRAARREDRVTFDERPDRAIQYALEQLKGLTSDEIAPLFGTSARTVRSWQHDPPKNPQVDTGRVTSVAQVLYDIAPSLTPRGALRWFYRERTQLDGQTPLSLLDRPTDRERLRQLARLNRGQGA